MCNGFKKFWTRMCDWRGTASRREFWWGVFGNAIIMLILLGLLIGSFFAYANPINPFSITMIVLFSLFCLVELFPSITLIIRRMHDIDKSGFYIFVLFIPLFGFIWYLWLVTRPSTTIPYQKV